MDISLLSNVLRCFTIEGLYVFLAAAAGLIVLWSLGIVVYNLFWHPLRKFPGPVHFAACRLPYVFNSFNGRLAVRFHELHDKYGPIVRTAPNELSFIESSAWKAIYDRKNPLGSPFRKNYDSFNETRTQIRHSLYIAGDQEHAPARKILNHAFSPESLRNQEALIKSHADDLIEAVDGEQFANKGVVDLEKWFTWAAFEIVSDLSFGQPFDCILQPTYRSWPAALGKVRRVICTVSGLKEVAPYFLSLLSQIVPVSFMQRFVLQKAVNSMAFDLGEVRKRIARKPNRGDLLSAIVQQSSEKGGMTDDAIMANASLFILAGTETVATLLCSVSYLLTQNPHAMRRLTQEIRGAFEQEDHISLQALSPMPYFNACIEEALRLVPPVPEGLPRVTPPGGANICGHWIPSGTEVQISTLAMSISSTNFCDAKSFVPERWLPAERSPVYEADNRQASQPFSVGPRNCIGQTVALSEVRLILAKMLWRYEMRYTGNSCWTDQPTYLLWDKLPLPMELTPRGL